MTPRDDEFDVYVSEGVLLEVWRGPRITLAQQFSEEWDGPIQSMTHPAAFGPPSQTETRAAMLEARQQVRAIVRRGWLTLFVCAALGFGVGALLVHCLIEGWTW